MGQGELDSTLHDLLEIQLSSFVVPDRLGWAVAELAACSPWTLIGKDPTSFECAHVELPAM
jgi:hypothetical protein